MSIGTPLPRRWAGPSCRPRQPDVLAGKDFAEAPLSLELSAAFSPVDSAGLSADVPQPFPSEQILVRIPLEGQLVGYCVHCQFGVQVSQYWYWLPSFS